MAVWGRSGGLWRRRLGLDSTTFITRRARRWMLCIAREGIIRRLFLTISMGRITRYGRSPRHNDRYSLVKRRIYIDKSILFLKNGSLCAATLLLLLLQRCLLTILTNCLEKACPTLLNKYFLLIHKNFRQLIKLLHQSFISFLKFLVLLL